MLFLLTLGFMFAAESKFLQNARPHKSKRLPNFIYILSDDLGYGDVPYADNVTSSLHIPTPNMQRMARNGMKLTNFYTNSVCSPSRCSLMTGRHSGHSSVRGNGGLYTPISGMTVAKLLQKTHATALIGKWGLGNGKNGGNPLHQGFDYFFGQLGDQEAWQWYPHKIWKQNESVVVNDHAQLRAGCLNGNCKWSNDMYTEQAIEFIRNSTAQRTPFFLYLAPTTPHFGKLPGVDLRYPTPLSYFDREFISEEWPWDVQGFAASVMAQDKMLGSILDEVVAQNIVQDTLIFFCGDNGIDLDPRRDFPILNDNGQLRSSKGSLHEGGLRQVLLAQWQGTIIPGSVSDRMFALWDFLPTVADIIGLSTSSLPQHDGVSLVGTLMGTGLQQHHKHLYWEYCGGGQSNSYPPGWIQAVRVDKWKGIRANKGRVWLYDLDADIGEHHDVAKHYPEVVSMIVQVMHDEHTEDEAWPSSTSATKCCWMCESDDSRNCREAFGHEQHCPKARQAAAFTTLGGSE